MSQDSTTNQPAAGAGNPPFYKNVQVLDKELHAKLKLKPATLSPYAFAKSSNAIMISATEFLVASREYPIVFGRTVNNEYVPLAMVGLREGENLFVDTSGVWMGKYVPAYVRRYPFLMSENDNNWFACIDRDYDGFSETEGEALFNEKGEPTELTNAGFDFMRQFQDALLRTRAFTRMLADLDLFELGTAYAESEGERQFEVAGVYIISEEKLRKLPEKSVHEMVQGDALRLIYAHLASMDLMQTLADRMSVRMLEQGEQMPVKPSNNLGA